MTDNAIQQDVATESLMLVNRVQRIIAIAQISGDYWFERNAILSHLSAGKRMNVRQIRADSTAVLDEKRRLAVAFEFVLQGLVHDENEQPTNEVVLQVQARFEIHYQLSDGAPPSDEAIQAFGKVNAQFNLTAFWREYVHSCFTRAGLPAFDIPPFNATKALEELRKPADPAPEAAKS